MNLTLQRFRALLDCNPASRYLIAYSGGLDSTVLLSLCSCLRSKGWISDFLVVHINHGLHPNADEWSDFCRDVCSTLAIQFQSTRVSVRADHGESLEEAARVARYQVFKKILRDSDILLTAHHRDDQAETLLLQLFRGAGVEGLAGMADAMPCGSGKLVRPLLTFPRQDLVRYAREKRLNWIEDSSNEDVSFDRNFLRHRVMPLLKERWVAVDKTVARSARHCAEAKRGLDLRAEQLLASVFDQNRGTLKISTLKSFDKDDKLLVIRHWIKRLGLRNPSTVISQKILNEVIYAASDRIPQVVWNDVVVSRYRDELYLFRKPLDFDPLQVIDWNGQDILDIPGDCGRLEVIQDAEIGIPKLRWRRGSITVRFRHGGESCRLPKRRGTHTLKKLFQEKSIPPWVRKRAPLIYIDGQLVAVADLWVCETHSGGGEGGYIGFRWSGYQLGWKSGDDNRDVVYTLHT